MVCFRSFQWIHSAHSACSNRTHNYYCSCHCIDYDHLDHNYDYDHNYDHNWCFCKQDPSSQIGG